MTVGCGVVIKLKGEYNMAEYTAHIFIDDNNKRAVEVTHILLDKVWEEPLTTDWHRVIDLVNGETLLLNKREGIIAQEI